MFKVYYTAEGNQIVASFVLDKVLGPATNGKDR